MSIDDMDYFNEVIGYNKNRNEVVFFRKTAESVKLIPLVELGHKEIIDAIHNDLKIKVDRLFRINFTINHENIKNIESIINAPLHAREISVIDFIEDVESGGYDEAIYVSNDIIVIFLGSDEAWIICSSDKYYNKNSPIYNNICNLVKLYIKNSYSINKFDRFRYFFSKIN